MFDPNNPNLAEDPFKTYQQKLDIINKENNLTNNAFIKLNIDQSILGNKDTVIYHYTTIETARDYILKEGTFRYGEITNLNDEQDFDVNIVSFNTNKQNYLNYMASFYPEINFKGIIKAATTYDLYPKRIIQDMYDKFIERIDNYGVLCFTRNYDTRLLWTHYGDKGKGICLGFKIKAVYGSIVSPVKYSPNMLRANYYNPDFDAFIFWVYQKDIQFEYEDEIRFFCRDVKAVCDQNRCITFDKTLLPVIYFGAKTSPGDIQSIKDVSKNKKYPKNIELYQLQKNFMNYGYLTPIKIPFY